MKNFVVQKISCCFSEIDKNCTIKQSRLLDIPNALSICTLEQNVSNSDSLHLYYAPC